MGVMLGRRVLGLAAFASAVSCNALTGCGNENGGDPSADAGPTDADTGSDGGGFNPDDTYPGEGTACEFSIFCAERQICVDGECIRHERVTADELELGEFRNLYGEDLEASPLYTEAHWDWDDREVLEGAIHSFVYPSPDGPQTLFFTDDIDDCQVASYGSDLRIFGIRDMACTTAAASPQGNVAIGGVDRPDGHAVVVLFDAEGAETARLDLTDFLKESAGTEIGEPVGGIPTSFMWDDEDERFLVSVSVGAGYGCARWCPSETGFYSDKTVFAAVTLGGSAEVLPIGDALVHDGARGWLLHDAAGAKAVLTDYWDGIGTDEVTKGGAKTELLDLSDGSRTTLLEGVSVEARFFQPSANDWFFVALDHPDVCQQTVFSSNGSELTLPWIYFDSAESCPEFREPVSPQPFNANGACGAVVPGHSAMLGSTMEQMRSDTRDWDLRFLQSERTARLSAPPTTTVLGQHSVSARFGKTYEVVVGYYEEPFDPAATTALSWWEATLRRE